VLQSLRRLAGVTAISALAALIQCGGSDLTLPGDTGPARISKVDGDNQTGAAGTELAKPLIVKVEDPRGNPVVDQAVAFAPAADVPGAAVDPAEARTGDDGTATARWVLGTVSGSQQVLARVTGDGVPDGIEATFDAIAGSSDPHQLHLDSGDDQTAAVGSAVAAPLVVLVTDRFGNPVSGVQVEWSAEKGSVDPSSSMTGADGRAETSWVLGASTGSQSAAAAVSGLDGSPVRFHGTAVAGAADKLVRVAGDRQTARPGQQLSSPLVVRLVDRNGNGVAGRPVSWVVGMGGGSVSSPNSSTDAKGEAETRWTLGPGSGSNTVNAVVSGVGIVSFTATASAGGSGGAGGGGAGGGGGGGGGGGPVPTRLAFVVEPSDTRQDQEISPPVEVAVLDQNGTRVTSGAFQVKLELQGHDGNLKGHRTQETRSGVAQFDDLKVDEQGEYRLRASTDGLTPTESKAFEILERDDHHHDDH
jgi:hypothetical protein